MELSVTCGTQITSAEFEFYNVPCWTYGSNQDDTDGQTLAIHNKTPQGGPYDESDQS